MVLVVVELECWSLVYYYVIDSWESWSKKESMTWFIVLKRLPIQAEHFTARKIVVLSVCIYLGVMSVICARHI
jgi:hypothetical protein